MNIERRGLVGVYIEGKFSQNRAKVSGKNAKPHGKTRVNILAIIPYFFPLPSTEISLFLPCFLVKKRRSNVEVCSKMARSAKILYFLFSKWVRMDKNSTKTGKNRSNYAKTGRFLGIYFSSAALFLPCFLAS